jgi:uncharacterized membrane protein HdeD (DUF308 family)
VVHFVWRKRSRAWFSHLVSPVLGFCILAYIMRSMAASTWELGTVWLLIGVVYQAILARTGRGGQRLELEG